MIIFSKYKNQLKGSFFIFTLLATLFAAPRNIIFAQSGSGNSAPTSIGLTISPPSIEITSNPGDIINNVIKVTSTSNDLITYETLVEDFRVEGQEGIVALQGEDNPNGFSKWFSIEPSTFQLKPKETKTINFTIKVPKDGEPGGHFASLLFQPKSIESATSGSGAQVLQRVGSLILMTVSGAINEKASVSKFEPKTFIGNWDTREEVDGKKTFVPRDEKLNEEKNKSYFNEGPVAFNLLLKNDGNVFYRPKGTVIIYNIFGQKVDELNVDSKNVFPGGGERRITVIWPKKNLWGIRYRANLVSTYGSKNQTLTAETTFWAFPAVAAISTVVVLILLLLLRKRLFKAISILAKG